MTVQNEGNRNVKRKVKYYNLDIIISVGYRVKSKQGTGFRQWATQKLKEILFHGYAINQKRLDELQQTIQFIQKSIDEEINLTEAKSFLEIIRQYTPKLCIIESIRQQFHQSKAMWHCW